MRSPFTVAQLPFHKMSTYPYPASEKFPDDADAIEYQLNWNDRFDSGEPVRSYRFDYRLMPSTPADDGTCGAADAACAARGSWRAVKPLVLQPAVRQLEMLRAREISVAELAEAHIAQIERLNPQLNAFADFDAERVRAQARAMDAAPDDPRGPLHGLPVTVKSSIATAGYRCEIGSLLHKGEIPREDAVVVARLRAAGALILGTTNCPEFLMAYETANLLHGQTRNPWDLERTPGGSSGGESAAIAAGMSAAGLGSDSGGSVRVPAHFTGICSLKPTPGRIPGRGHLPPCVGPFSTLGAIGPMARTIADVDADVSHAERAG